eukprot:4893985-Lingulodinium_polyedra.AAC.1
MRRAAKTRAAEVAPQKVLASQRRLATAVWSVASGQRAGARPPAERQRLKTCTHANNFYVQHQTNNTVR